MPGVLKNPLWQDFCDDAQGIGVTTRADKTGGMQDF